MKKALEPGAKMRLLHSTAVLNKENVAQALGIAQRSASNLLQRWAADGTLYRTAPGEYISSFSSADHDQLALKAIAKRVGTKVILVGASSWKRVGWCDSSVLHVAVPLRPSRPIPKIRNAVIYPVGAKQWLELSRHAVQMDLDKPPILHPLTQMLWWMDEDESPVEMPSPDKVNWKAICAEPDVASAMIAHWPNELSGPPEQLDVPLLYRMLHMDRLSGRAPGRAEPLEEQPLDPQFGI